MPWLVLGRVSRGLDDICWPFRQVHCEGCHRLASAGGGRTGREEDGKFTFITSGTLPDLSLISLQLISCLPPAQQNTIHHCWGKLMSAGPSTRSNLGSLGGPFLPGTRDAGESLGVGGVFLGLLRRGPGVLCHLGRLQEEACGDFVLLQHSNFVRGDNVLAPGKRLIFPDPLSAREGM